jgi:hypothetical protein
MADLDASIEQLYAAGKFLHQNWEDRKSLWNDPVSQSFEKDFLAVFESQTQFTLQEMQRLAYAIAEAKRRIGSH